MKQMDKLKVKQIDKTGTNPGEINEAFGGQFEGAEHVQPGEDEEVTDKVSSNIRRTLKLRMGRMSFLLIQTR